MVEFWYLYNDPILEFAIFSAVCGLTIAVGGFFFSIFEYWSDMRNK
jgi:CDP-diglyceride synthetase